MVPGTILFDRNFRFTDGTTGEKLFVILCDGSSGHYLVAKTTSNGARYGIVHGCQTSDRFLNFHLVKNSCPLDEPTWIQLHEFFDYSANNLDDSVTDDRIRRICVLEEKLTLNLLNCASYSEDLTPPQEDRIQESIAALDSKLSKNSHSAESNR